MHSKNLTRNRQHSSEFWVEFPTKSLTVGLSSRQSSESEVLQTFLQFSQNFPSAERSQVPLKSFWMLSTRLSDLYPARQANKQSSSGKKSSSSTPRSSAQPSRNTSKRVKLTPFSLAHFFSSTSQIRWDWKLSNWISQLTLDRLTISDHDYGEE